MSSKKAVLVIEDHDGLRRGLQYGLSETCEVLVAASGEEALALPFTRVPQVILTDYNLPGELKGIALLEALRAKFPNARLVVLSGDNSLDGNKLKAKGVASVLFKAEVDDLIGACQQAVAALDA